MSRQPDYDRAATAACRVLLRLRVDSLPVRPLEMLRRCRDTYLCTFDQAADVLNLDDDELDRLSGGADAFTHGGVFAQLRSGKLRIAAAEVQPVQPLRQSRIFQRAEGHELRAERR